MKILTVADTVSNELLELSESGTFLQEIDLIISCGDLPPEYLTSLRHRYDVPLFYVLGNHDLRYGTAPPVGCQSIDRNYVSHRGIKLVGFSGSRWYNGGENQYTDKEMAKFIARMRFTFWRQGGPDIVVSHAPPRYINDAEDLCHRGFKSFAKMIRKYSPRYLIHGHIHRFFENNEERISTVHSTQVVNSYGFNIIDIESC